MTEKDNKIIETARWEQDHPEGFYGIVTNPRGEEGFLSRIGGGVTWTKIGKGQDPVEVMRAAKALHDATLSYMQSSNGATIDRLQQLADKVNRLTRPKN